MAIPQISVEELAAKLKSGERVHLLDVRQHVEHQLAVLPGSQLIPLHELPARWKEIDCEPDRLIVAYCHHGMRSLHAAHFLTQAGFVNVVSLSGGIDAWSIRIDPAISRY